MPRRRSLSFWAVKPRMEEPSKVRLSQLFEQELLVVIEHAKAAFQVAEEHRDCLDPLFAGEVVQSFFADPWARRNAVRPLLLWLAGFALPARQQESVRKSTQFVAHSTQGEPSTSKTPTP